MASDSSSTKTRQMIEKEQSKAFSTALQDIAYSPKRQANSDFGSYVTLLQTLEARILAHEQANRAAGGEGATGYPVKADSLMSDKMAMDYVTLTHRLSESYAQAGRFFPKELEAIKAIDGFITTHFQPHLMGVLVNKIEQLGQGKPLFELDKAEERAQML